MKISQIISNILRFMNASLKYSFLWIFMTIYREKPDVNNSTDAKQFMNVEMKHHRCRNEIPMNINYITLM